LRILTVQIRQWIEKTTGYVVMSLSKETMPDLMKEFADSTKIPLSFIFWSSTYILRSISGMIYASNLLNISRSASTILLS